MDLQQAILKMSEELLPNFLNNIPEEEKGEFEKIYLERLESNYGPALEENLQKENELENLIRTLINKEKIQWANASFQNKKQYFLVDENFNLLQKLSDEVFEKVIDNYHDENIDFRVFNYEDVIATADQYLENIKDFNKEMARKYYANLVIDMNYLFKQSDAISSRFRQYIENNSKEEGTNIEKDDSVDNIIEKSEANPNDLIKEAEIALTNEDFKKANRLLDAFLNIVQYQYKDTKEDRYFCFNNSVEYLLYMTKFDPKETIHDIGLNTNKAYLLKSYVLSDLKRYQEALSFLDSAFAWNPIYVNAYLKQAKIYRVLKEYDKWYEKLNEAHEYIYDVHNLGRYYRYLGYYYTTKNDYKTAIALHTLSYIYNGNEKNITAIEDIASLEGKKVEPMEFAEIQEILTAKNIPISITATNAAILEAIYESSKDDKEMFDYVKSLLYGITKSDKYAE